MLIGCLLLPCTTPKMDKIWFMNMFYCQLGLTVTLCMISGRILECISVCFTILCTLTWGSTVIVVKSLIYHGLLKQTKQVHRYFSGGTLDDLTQDQTQRTAIFKKNNVEKTKHMLHWCVRFFCALLCSVFLCHHPSLMFHCSKVTLVKRKDQFYK